MQPILTKFSPSMQPCMQSVLHSRSSETGARALLDHLPRPAESADHEGGGAEHRDALPCSFQPCPASWHPAAHSAGVEHLRLLHLLLCRWRLQTRRPVMKPAPQCPQNGSDALQKHCKYTALEIYHKYSVPSSPDCADAGGLTAAMFTEHRQLCAQPTKIWSVLQGLSCLCQT